MRRKHDNYSVKGLVKAADAAKILKISKSMMYQMMQRGEIPSVRFGRSVGVRATDLEEFIDGNAI